MSKSVGSEEKNITDRHFYLQLKVKHNFPTVTAFYGGQELESGKSFIFELLHGSQKGSSVGSVGIGIEYQTTRKYDHLIPSTRSISFLPIYAKWQLGFDMWDNFNLYVGGQYGYNFVFFNDTSNSYSKSRDGRHFGIMFGGIIYKKILIESSLTVNSGELSHNEGSNKTSIRCPTLSFGLGLRFG